MYLEHKKTVNNPKDFKNIEKTITDRLKLKKEITKKDLDFAKMFVETSLKKDCGTNSEKSIIKKHLKITYLNLQVSNTNHYLRLENNLITKASSLQKTTRPIAKAH
jgi:hypothetical protein